MKSAFSLTPDPRFYFRSRSHSRVFDALSSAISRRESLMLVMGDLGVGKTTLCKTLLDTQERRSRAALAGNALLSPEDLLRLMLQDHRRRPRRHVCRVHRRRHLQAVRRRAAPGEPVCERGLQEAADAGATIVEARMTESAASALDLIRLKPKRFRWQSLNQK